MPLKSNVVRSVFKRLSQLFFFFYKAQECASNLVLFFFFRVHNVKGWLKY